MPLKITPEEAAEKWERKMQAASTDYAAGVGRVTKAPGQAAAENIDGYIRGVQENAQRWKKKVAAVSLEEWKDKAINKGASRLGPGATAARAKMMEQTKRNFANIESVKSAVDQMPGQTLDQRIAKSAAFIRGMAEKKLS